MNLKDWARHEVEIACKKENPNRKPGEWDYGCACYESALKAFNSLAEDGHSGMSFSFTKEILNRLMNNKPLTPITDEDFVENENSIRSDPDYLKERGLKSSIQCPRMSSLFRDETLDGIVTYTDVNRVTCFDKGNPNVTYGFGFFTKIINEMFPISMPYYPPNLDYYLECSELCYDPKNGDFDTVALWNITTPTGEKIKVNRFWRESSDGFIEISEEEWNDLEAEIKQREEAKAQVNAFAAEEIEHLEGEDYLYGV